MAPDASNARLLVASRVVSFALGAAVIVDALAAAKPANVQWLVGLILIGAVPVDGVTHLIRRRDR